MPQHMKQLLITIFTMGMFNLFGQDKPKQDPYWDFDKQTHFRPKLNKGDFFKLTGFDFVWFVFEPISKFIKDKDHEVEKGKSLSYGQKALYYWWFIDGEVTNGGFEQFYYNGYGSYVPTIIKSLEYIGDKKMAELIQRAENIYQKNKKLIDKAREKDLFGSDLYERLEEMSALDEEYYNLNSTTMTKIEKYIKKNPNEICLDEEGKEFDMKFSGECKTFYSENAIKDIFYLENGIVSGEFKSFYQSGKIKEEIQYSKGEPTGERVEYYENGNKKYSIRKNPTLKQFEHYWYYENGKPKKLEHKLLDKDERIGVYKQWYDNGQLAETGNYESAYKRDGIWLEFYKDGSKKLEAESKNGDFLIQNCWNEKGEQTLKDGTGLYIYNYSGWEGHFGHTEKEFKNYKRHGQQKLFNNGVLGLYQEMENGVENGYTRYYYKNGKIKEEKLYKDGKVISSKTFPKSDNPIGKVSFQYLMKDEWLKKEDLPTADTYPTCVNEDEIKKLIKIPKILFELQYQDLEGATGLWLSVDEKGNVTDIKFKSAYMTGGQEFTEVADKMKFKPATKGGKNIASFIYIIASFNIE
jgi:antitoxin component YwqK of YwqJK toxin-antitoxin module